MSELENTPREMDRMIACVYSFPDGTVAVFDRHGRQMPQYEGRGDDVMERIVAHATPSTFFGAS